MPKHRSYGKEVFGGFVDARCPCCGKPHRLRLMWIGRGFPRVFCPACKEHRTPEYEDLDGTQYNSRAARGPIHSIW